MCVCVCVLVMRRLASARSLAAVAAVPRAVELGFKKPIFRLKNLKNLKV